MTFKQLCPLFQSWFECCLSLCNAPVQFWCCCLCDSQTILVIVSISANNTQTIFINVSSWFGCCFFSAMLWFNFGVVVHATLKQFWPLFQFWFGCCSFLCNALVQFWCCCSCNAPKILVIVSISLLFQIWFGCCFFHDTLVSPLSFNGPLPELGITFHLHYISFALHLKILPHQHKMHDTSRFKCHALHLHFMK